jgi:hypothetical protein
LGVIRRLFPGITIPSGTSEIDDLWLQSGGIETIAQMEERVEGAFKGIWNMSVDDECMYPFSHTSSNLCSDSKLSLLSPTKIFTIPSTPGFLGSRNRISKRPK